MKTAVFFLSLIFIAPAACRAEDKNLYLAPAYNNSTLTAMEATIQSYQAVNSLNNNMSQMYDGISQGISFYPVCPQGGVGQTEASYPDAQLNLNLLEQSLSLKSAQETFEDAGRRMNDDDSLNGDLVPSYVADPDKKY